MHYGDEEQIEKNILRLVVYKHSTDIVGIYDYTIESIQDCKYFPTYLLEKILMVPEYYFGKILKEEEQENWYLIELKSPDGYYEYEVMSITNITKVDDEFLKLH